MKSFPLECARVHASAPRTSADASSTLLPRWCSDEDGLNQRILSVECHAGGRFELQREQISTSGATATLAENGLNAETFRFVITAALQFKSFVCVCVDDFAHPSERRVPFMSASTLLTVCLHQFVFMAAEPDALQPSEAASLTTY